ncbi:MAG: Ni/Fe hydrogenase subunit alpha [Pseudomonadota bacterium]
MGEKTRRIEINVPTLARVEGEGALELTIEGNRIEALRLRIYEPPRYFEKFLEGREYHEVPDITARICGICPVAYQMSAVQALERAFGVQTTPWIDAMRRLLYCGEWIQSHALHVHLLALPDFLGFDDALTMGKEYPAELRRGLRLQGVGNAIIRLLGGRSVHPVGARVGGFYRAPAAAAAEELRSKVGTAIKDAAALVAWVARLEMPEVEQDFISVALRHADEYSMYGGRVVSSDGLDCDVAEFEQHFREEQVPHSTALHGYYHDQPYLVGPLARLNLNIDRLPDASRELLDRTGIAFPSRNVYHSMLARALEIHVALVEALRLLSEYRPTDSPWIAHESCAGVGYGASEAPRGLLWHRYDCDADGLIRHARIVPPTSQNQARIEQDIANTLTALGLQQPAETLRLEAERVIRNYDPCISCAVHFLKLDLQRR